MWVCLIKKIHEHKYKLLSPSRCLCVYGFRVEYSSGQPIQELTLAQDNSPFPSSQYLPTVMHTYTHTQIHIYKTVIKEKGAINLRVGPVGGAGGREGVK